MFNRCKYCNSKCPDFSDMCDCCANIEDECNKEFEEWKGEIEDEM